MVLVQKAAVTFETFCGAESADAVVAKAFAPSLTGRIPPSTWLPKLWKSASWYIRILLLSFAYIIGSPKPLDD